MALCGVLRPRPDPVSADEGDAGTQIAERTLVVGTLTAPVPENTATVSTFAEAILELGKDLSITTIDVRSSDSIPMRPFDLQLANRTVPRLTIRGNLSAMPTIVFTPGEEDAALQTPAMIRVHGGELHLENLHLRMEKGKEQEQGRGGSTSLSINDSRWRGGKGETLYQWFVRRRAGERGKRFSKSKIGAVSGR